MKTKSLKGFTILEALISLMLMSIIIGITYSLFNLVGKQLSLFESENAQVLAYNLFNTSLLGDINKANDFNIIDNQLILKSYDDTEVLYVINNRSILRQKTFETDTFDLSVIDFAFSSNDISNPLNGTLKIELTVLNDTVTTHYFLKKNNSEIINTMYFNEN